MIYKKNLLQTNTAIFTRWLSPNWYSFYSWSVSKLIQILQVIFLQTDLINFTGYLSPNRSSKFYRLPVSKLILQVLCGNEHCTSFKAHWMLNTSNGNSPAQTLYLIVSAGIHLATGQQDDGVVRASSYLYSHQRQRHLGGDTPVTQTKASLHRCTHSTTLVLITLTCTRSKTLLSSSEMNCCWRWSH